MISMFKTKDKRTVTYVKMYSTFSDEVAERCFAFILMPISQQRRLVSVQSIQFDFNERGEVLVLSIHYSGHDRDIQKKVQETMKSIDTLKKHYGRGTEFAVFNNKKNTLKLGFYACSDSQSYLSAIFDLLSTLYCMKSDFVQDIKMQLLNQEYLASEFMRLRGKPIETDIVCVVM